MTNEPPFPSAEAAWFWAARALETATPDALPPLARQVVACLDLLYRRRRIELLHARILRVWGRRGVAPNPARLRERSDWRLWREALQALDGALCTRGLLRRPPSEAPAQGLDHELPRTDYQSGIA